MTLSLNFNLEFSGQIKEVFELKEVQFLILRENFLSLFTFNIIKAEFNKSYKLLANNDKIRPSDQNFIFDKRQDGKQLSRNTIK